MIVLSNDSTAETIPLSEAPLTSPATSVAINGPGRRLSASGPHRAVDGRIESTDATDLNQSTTTSINLESGSTRRYAYAPPIYQPQPQLEASYTAPYTASSSQARYDTKAPVSQSGSIASNELDNTAPTWVKSQSVADADGQKSPDPPAASSLEPNDASPKPATLRSALKRKAHSVDPPAPEATGNQPAKDPGSRPPRPRTVSFVRMSAPGPGASSADEGKTPAQDSGAQGGADVPPRTSAVQEKPTASSQKQGADSQRNQQATSSRRTRAPSAHPPSILPPERVFPIQIGSELFRLSGASISSDAPSYFTQFFEQQIPEAVDGGGIRTLYIDRDPVTFREVARHLQGYSIKPRDGSDFVKLFADAQFYSLPRLINQLFESEIFIQIGEQHFQIPRDIFSEPGNSPNFFSLGFAVFFAGPGEVFPGLDRKGLLRPPAILPPSVPGRSAETFSEILHLLRGYPLNIRNEAHRSELLRDCRYFNLRGLEQKIIAHEISYNLERQKHEICLRLEDIKPSGVSFHQAEEGPGANLTGGWVYYARPFVDDSSYELVVEIGDECTLLDLSDMRVNFHNLAKARVSSLFQVVANKMNLPTEAPLGLIMLSGPGSASASPGHTPLSEDRVKARFEPASDITLDGERLVIDWTSPQGHRLSQGSTPSPKKADAKLEFNNTTASSGSVRDSAQAEQFSSEPPVKRRKTDKPSAIAGEWVIRTGLWRLRVQPTLQNNSRGRFEIVLTCVKIDAYSNERARNRDAQSRVEWPVDPPVGKSATPEHRSSDKRQEPRLCPRRLPQPAAASHSRHAQTMAYSGPTQANIDPALQHLHLPPPNAVPNPPHARQAQQVQQTQQTQQAQQAQVLQGNNAPPPPLHASPHAPNGSTHPPSTPTFYARTGHAAAQPVPQDSPVSGSPSGSGNHNDGNELKRPRACEACRQLKVKCEMDDTSVPCKRCAKANRQCTVTAPSRKRQKKTDSRVAELEKKIDALTASLAARGGDPDDLPPPNSYASHWSGPPPPPLSLPPHGTKRPLGGDRGGDYFGGELQRPVPSTSYQPALPQPSLAANSHIGHAPLRTRPEEADTIFDPITHGFLDPPTARRCWDRYLTEMSGYVPIIVFPAGTRWEDVRKTKPVLFLSVVAVACGVLGQDIQGRLLRETTRVFADRIIIRGEKSLELVQAILCMTTFYQPPEKYEELNFNQLIHIAAVMALDLGLGKRFKKGNAALWRSYTEQKRVMPDPNSAETRRCWLGCYFMCSNSAMSLRRPLLIRWSPYAEECIGILTTAPDAAPTDKWLCQLVRGQHLAEDIGLEFSMDDPACQLSLTDHKTQYHLKAFERQLAEWYESAAPERQQQAILKHSYGVINLYMHEIAMHHNHNIDDFRPPFHATPIEGPPDPDFVTPTHIESLATCMNSVHTVFDAFLSMDVAVLRSLPTLFFVRNSYAAVALIKMYTAVSAKGSKFGRIIKTDDLKVDYYLERMISKLVDTAEGGMCKVAQKFCLIFNMLKQWHVRRTDPDYQDGNRSRPASRNRTPLNAPQPSNRQATGVHDGKTDSAGHHHAAAAPPSPLGPERRNSNLMGVPAQQDPSSLGWETTHVPSQQQRNGLHMLSDAAMSPVHGQSQAPPTNPWGGPGVGAQNHGQLQTLPPLNPDMDPNLMYAGAPGMDGMNMLGLEPMDLMAYGFGDEFMAMGFGMVIDQGGWAFNIDNPRTLLDIDEAEYEQALHDALREARVIARTEAYTTDVLIAKLAVLAIRQLHASDVFPRTALRAMVLMEFDEENRSTGGEEERTVVGLGSRVLLLLVVWVLLLLVLLLVLRVLLLVVLLR
ncbi:hypothetical protein DV735_g2120, partial [Chaetothyriales sp. CBS 134920]